MNRQSVLYRYGVLTDNGSYCQTLLRRKGFLGTSRILSNKYDNVWCPDLASCGYLYQIVLETPGSNKTKNSGQANYNECTTGRQLT